MHKESKIAVRGKVKGHFELHFEGVLEKEVVITQRLCAMWNEVAAVYILSGKHSDEEFRKLFEFHFKVKLDKAQTMHELCVRWSAWGTWMRENEEIWNSIHP